MALHRVASGQEDEAALVQTLQADDRAQPLLSLVAVESERIVGHVLLTYAVLLGPEADLDALLLAPLAVRPDCQRRGIGGTLVMRGLEAAVEADVALVFVLGHPAYCRRFEFQPAGVRHLAPPYPLPAEYADAWMVADTRGPGVAGATGRVLPARALRAPEF